jgi:hypothetical protein
MAVLLAPSCAPRRARAGSSFLASMSNGVRRLVRGFSGRPMVHVDPRNNVPRTGRVPVALGRDAADVPIMYTFGPNTCQFQGVDARGLLALSVLSGRTTISSGFYALQSRGLGEPQPNNLPGLIDPAQLKISERLQASVTEQTKMITRPGGSRARRRRPRVDDQTSSTWTFVFGEAARKNLVARSAPLCRELGSIREFRNL